MPREMLAHQLETEMRMGRVGLEPKRVQLLDRLGQLDTGRLAAPACLRVNLRVDHAI